MKWATGLRVLIVNDDPEFTAALQEELADMGFEIEVAIDVGDAISRLLTHVPDLVCANLNLPRGSGYDICDLIRGDETLRAVRIIVMSDRHSPEDIAFAEEAGANAFLKLPLSPRAPADAVEMIFHHRARSPAELRRLCPSRPPAPLA